MKVYAIVCESGIVHNFNNGAGSIRKQIEMVCKSYKIAESYFLNEDFFGRPVRIDEMEIIGKMWEPPKPKKKKVKK